MAVKVLIPTPLQKLTNGKAEVECSAQNILELVDALEQDYPGMKERLSDGGKIRRFINLYVNEEDIRFMQKEETALKDGDSISIVPAIAGGSGKMPGSPLVSGANSDNAVYSGDRKMQK